MPLTKAAESVCDYSKGSTCAYFRRFSLILKADKMAVQPMNKYNCNGGISPDNCVYAFPSPTGDLGGGECRAACNISISPSGAVVGSYFSGAHTQLELGDNTPGVYPLGDAGAPWGYGIDLFNQVKVWAGEDVGSGCELIRWAVNSDKWVLQNVGWYGHADAISEGSNSVACDWIDKVAFNITKNPKLPSADANGVMHINSCTGDMWIDDPANNPSGNKYEDLQGVWHSVGSTDAESQKPTWKAAHRPSVSFDENGNLRIDVSPDGYADLRITNIRGSTLYSCASAGKLMIRAGTLKPGLCLMRGRQGAKMICTAITISR